MKRKLALIMVISLILSLGAFSTVSFAADNDEITITTGEEFVEKVISDNFGSTFVIEGKETTADGSLGIILPDTFASIESFYGTLKGTDGCNTIQLAKTSGNEKGLFGKLAAKTVNIENINIIGAGTNGAGAVSTAANTSGGVSPLVSLVNGSDTNLTIKNLNNYVAINASTYAGGFVARLNYGTINIENCCNYGTITNTSNGAAGFVGSSRRKTSKITINSSVNHGNIVTTGTGGGGFYGSETNSEPAVLTIANCANYGTVSTTSRIGVAGFAGYASNVNISGSYNVGNIDGQDKVAGFIGNALTTATNAVSSCFNVGTISAQYTGAQNLVSGITYKYATVTNSYNIGSLYAVNTANYETYAITASTAEGCGNNYYAAETNTKIEDDETISTKTTLADLAKALPTGFTSVEDGGVWTYTTDESYNYSLPQISGNEFVNTLNNDWYIEASEEPTLAESVSYTSYEGTVYDEENEEITDYAIVVTKFEVPESATSYTYGMLLHEANEDFNAENASAKAPASKNVGGAYGILFYGNRFAEGKTYYVRPYVEIDGTYTLGEITSFVFSAE